MLRFVMAFVAGAGLSLSIPLVATADIGLTQNNQVLLSCSDGHSVMLWVDSATLTSVVTDVDSINASDSGMSCTIGTAATDPSAETTEWTVYDYNPSDNAIAPRNSPNSLPATSPDGGATWQFLFRPNHFTALFTTTDPSVTGNDYGKTLTDTIRLTGSADTFMTQKGGGDCSGNFPAVVRFYFTSPAASGPSTGNPPAGFYTRFWWSDAVNMQMVTGTQSQKLVETMTPADWSDWNGQPASEFPATFAEAASHVQSIGLSFGGNCFFETGVTPVPAVSDEQLSSSFNTA